MGRAVWVSHGVSACISDEPCCFVETPWNEFLFRLFSRGSRFTPDSHVLLLPQTSHMVGLKQRVLHRDTESNGMNSVLRPAFATLTE